VPRPGFAFREAQRRVAAGLIETPTRLHADTPAMMEWMDSSRSTE
jgi:hypothetical protein